MATFTSVHDATDHTGITGVGLDEGTSFPGSPSADDLFYRTDRNKIYYYDGTRWLTTAVSSMDLTTRVAQGATGYADSGTVANAPTLGAAGDMWVEEFRAVAFAQGTLDGSNFYVITLDKLTSANAATNVATLTMNSQTTNTWKQWVTAIGAAVVGSSHLAFRVVATKTGTGVGVILGLQLTYREIG